MNNLKIAVAFHRPAQIDDYIKDKNIYVPIYSGNDWNTDMYKDNTGINCADLNKEINQITQLYWFANRLEEFGDPDYIGLHHYRRFLNFDVHNLKPDTIQATWFNLKGLSIMYQLIFSNESNQQNCKAFFNNFLLFNTKDTELFNQYMDQHWFYACNLFIMPKDIFKEYLEYIKIIIDLCYFYKNHKPQMFKHNSRILSMYFERLTGFFLYKKEKEGIKIQHCPIITPQKYFEYILKNILSGDYFIYKNNCYYRVNKANYFLKELQNKYYVQ